MDKYILIVFGEISRFQTFEGIVDALSSFKNCFLYATFVVLVNQNNFL